ncbi:ABC transporter substrate-binding protein [Cohnella sp. CFH 77786]|uniref:ABC transporter substrate-binding protein n=1 Tax=Cohnella sp. CFH 77786 TaxID=2662265 RepID=UPI001C60D5F1
MRLAEDYLQLRTAFPDRTDGQPFRVTIGELAKALYCTPRNARLVMRKMEELKWVRFVSGRGRGHASEMTFFMDAERLALDEAKEYVKQGDVQGALSWLNQHAGRPEDRAGFMEWLTRYFGYQAEPSEEDRVTETLRLPIYRPIVTLDPANAVYSHDIHLIKQIHATLVNADAGGRLTKGVAHHWETNEDAVSWTFYLRKGVLFHDGRELTAEDAAYSLLRVKRETNHHDWLCRDIADILVESRYRLRIELHSPNRLFAWYMSHPAVSILPRIGGDPADAGRLPIGAGPYRVAKLTPGICVLEAFPSCFDGRGLMDRVEIIIVPESEKEFGLEINAGLLVVRTGESPNPTLRQWTEHRLLTGCSMLTMNLRKEGVLQNLNFRQALFHAIDRRRLVSELGYPHAAPAMGFHMENDPRENDPAYRPELAVSELLRSGYLGEPLVLYTYKRHAETAYWLQNRYGQLGIRLDVRIVPWADMLNRERIQEADLILFEASLSEGTLRQLEYLLARISFIRGTLNDELQKAVDLHIGRMLLEPDPADRHRQLQLLEACLMEQYSAVYLSYKEVSVLSHPTLQGVKFNPLGWVDFKDIWFRKPLVDV